MRYFGVKQYFYNGNSFSTAFIGIFVRKISAFRWDNTTYLFKTSLKMSLSDFIIKVFNNILNESTDLAVFNTTVQHIEKNVIPRVVKIAAH